MKILMISPRFPWPLDTGDRLTIYKYAECFSSKGHQVTLVTFVENGENPDLDRVSSFFTKLIIIRQRRYESYMNCLIGLFVRRPFQVSYYKSASMRMAIEELLQQENFDVLFSHTIRVADYIKDVPHSLKYLAMQVSMALTFRRLYENARSLAVRAFAAIEYLLVRHYEAGLISHFHTCSLISNADLKEVARIVSARNVVLLPHGVDHLKFSYSEEDFVSREPCAIVFSGNMGYLPNVDAIVYFAKRIFPMILKDEPSCKLMIVGRRPAAEVRKLADLSPNIVVTGEVDDMSAFLRKATIGINPLRIGSGLQNKVIEGFACGLPMVISSVANEGIGAAPGRDVMIADTAEDFARTVVRTLKDCDLQRQLAANGRRFIEEQYTWQFFLEKLEHHFENGATLLAPVFSPEPPKRKIMTPSRKHV